MTKENRFDTKEWTAPVIEKIPTWVAGTAFASRLLTDRKKTEWEFLAEPIREIPSPFAKQQDFDFSKKETADWKPVIVPSSLVMQGFDIENNVEYYYRRTLEIPKDYAGKRIFLQFEGVYSHCRVWVDGKYAGTHLGGFTAWNCDITEFVSKGADCISLVVGVADIEGSNPGTWNENGEKLSDSAWASYYAHHNIGGILRDITMFALPESHFTRTWLDTALDAPFEEGTLTANVEIETGAAEARQISVKAEVLDGEKIVAQAAVTLGGITAIQDSSAEAYAATPGNSAEARAAELQNPCVRTMDYPAEWIETHPEAYANDQKYEGRYEILLQNAPKKPVLSQRTCTLQIPVTHPKLWDAEHPNLYTVRLTLSADGQEVQKNEYRIGFRQIWYGGVNGTEKNRVYINGKEIKLRGVCRHDVSWKYGRSMSKEELRHEILSYKKNNINHLRTSHYPASEELLSLCDEYGIYVELENSACFKGANDYEIYNEPQEFIQTFAEMIEYSRNHSCIIIWSLANESDFEKTYGFRKEYRYVKETDPTRPVIFSYPETVTSTPLPYDIFSRHYADIASEPLGKAELPVLHDEFAHIPCYNLDELGQENSSRIIWGDSIRTGWEKIMQTEGALGCALWGAVDDIFSLPEHTSERHQRHSRGKSAGYGAWGAVLDQYGREKPEAYLTKKAFSPIRLDEAKSGAGKELTLFVKNWYDHTNLKELELVCKKADGTVMYRGKIEQDIAPHTEGKIVAALGAVEETEVFVEFWNGEYQVDAFCLKNAGKAASAQDEERLCAGCTATAESAKQAHADSIITATDSMTAGLSGSAALSVTDGSFQLHSAAAEPLLSGIRLYTENLPKLEEQTFLKNELENGTGSFEMKQRYDNGLQCLISGSFDGKRFCLAVDTDGSEEALEAYDRFGITMELGQQVEQICWERKGLYSVYPDNHIGRNRGCASAYRNDRDAVKEQYGKKPAWGWKDDSRDDFLYMPDDLRQFAATRDFNTKRLHILRYEMQDASGRKLTLIPLEGDLAAYVRKAPFGNAQALRQTEPAAEELPAEQRTAEKNVQAEPCATTGDTLQITLGAYEKSLNWGNYCGKKPSVQEKKHFVFEIDICDLQQEGNGK